MKSDASTSLIGRVIGAAAARPGRTIALATLLMALSLGAMTTLRSSASLDDLIDQSDPAAAALARIASNFRSVDQLLLVATDTSTTPSEARLVAFAERFAEAVDRDTDLAQMVEQIRFGTLRQGPERRYFEEIVIPNGLYFLDDAGLRSLAQRLSPEGMAKQIRRNEELIAAPGPAADAVSRNLLRDPLRLFEFLDFQVNGPATGSAADNAYFTSRDGASILVRISASRPASDLEFTSTLMSRVQDTANDVKEDSIEIAFTGAYAIAAASEGTIRSDMIRSVLGSLLLMQVLYLLAYRRLISFPIAILPAALGIVVAFGVYAMLGRTLNPPTAVIGAILAGLGVDYSIHLLSHTQQTFGDDARPPAVATALAAPLTLATVTSILGLVAIGQSHVQALRDFALLAIIGLALSLAATLLVLPAMLTLLPSLARPTTSRLSLQPFLDRVGARPVFVMICSAIIWIAALIVIGVQGDAVVPVNTDLHAMHPQPNAPLDLNETIAQRFGDAPEALPVLIEADTPRGIVTKAHQVAAALEPHLTTEIGVHRVYGLSTLLPPPDTSKSTQTASLPAAETAVQRFREAIIDSLFNPDAFENYEKFLRDFLDPDAPPTIETLLGYPAMASTILTSDAVSLKSPASSALTLVFLNDVSSDAEAHAHRIESIRSALAHIPGVTLTGITVVGHDTQLAVRRDMWRLLLIATFAVILLLSIVLRNPMDVATTLIPTAFGLSCVLASIHLFGDGLNMINLIGFPLLAGIGVDDGIFITGIARTARRAGLGAIEVRARLAASLHAITVTSATTGLAFGSLMVTSVPAIQSLGRMTAIGIAACWVASVFLLAPIVLMHALRREDAAV